MGFFKCNCNIKKYNLVSHSNIKELNYTTEYFLANTFNVNTNRTKNMLVNFANTLRLVYNCL